jgi:hypothetical protein
MVRAKTDLLIDWIYASTFGKVGKDKMPILRQKLLDARRIVLDDAMAALLYTMMVETYSVKRGGMSEKAWLKRCHGRLDDCRYFARLPHRTTWVEYALAPMLQREITTREDSRSPYCGPEDDMRHTISRNSRIGWLFEQHPEIDQAVKASYFFGGVDGSDKIVKWAASPMEILWCTEDAPLPWEDHIRAEDLPNSPLSCSEFVTTTRGYDRYNVSTRCKHHDEEPWASRSVLNATQGRARMMWCFLATFNKVPIIGQTRVVPSKGFVGRGAYHKFLEHKVLTINVPEKKALRIIARNAISLIRRRAHQVRGHWRDDWRLPRGNKRLWVPEHQRGDASIGFVTHDYLVTHD